MAIFVGTKLRDSSIGTTVALTSVGKGEYAATYWEDSMGAFVKVYGVSVETSVVDAPAKLRLRYLAKESGKLKQEITQLKSTGFTEAQLTELRTTLSEEHFNHVKRLLKKVSYGALLEPFEVSCLEQIRQWFGGSSKYRAPLSHKQFHALKRMSEKKHVQSSHF